MRDGARIIPLTLSFTFFRIAPLTHASASGRALVLRDRLDRVRRTARTFFFVAACVAFFFAAPSVASAEDPSDTDLANGPLSPVVPPPLNTPYLQYGVAFTALFVAAPGAMCSHPDPPCILGSGGGIAVRVGWRSAGPWYFGGAYELTKQDPNKLYRLATLQQLRFEARYYITTGRDTQPYLTAGAGIGGYGNEGGIQTYGPSAFLGIGVETQLSRRTVVGIALGYQLIKFKSFSEDGNPLIRDPGYASLIGIDLILEGRDPL